MEDTLVENKNNKRTDFLFNFYIVTFGGSFWREKINARLARKFQFFSTVFINPDIFIK